jgi:tRNA synthetases class I (C) catalytic domain
VPSSTAARSSSVSGIGHLTSDADEGPDKVELGAKRQGRSAWEIAAFYTEAFQRHLARLHIQAPHIWCKATDHIPEMIDLIRCIEERGFTYRTTDGMYFDTSLLPDYGKLALLDLSGQQAGARIGVNDEKRNPQDFALWKFSAPVSTAKWNGTVRGESDFPAGILNVQPCPPATSGSRSTSTPEGPIIFRSTIRMR